MKTLYITTALLLCTLLAPAQSEEDALRFSRLHHYGSARMTAMGGAFGALGGDLSTFAVNPGGIGVFRKSEVSFTSTLDFAKIKSGRFDRDKNAYLVGSLGFVASFTTGDPKWKYVNFGVNYTNLNNFNRDGRLGGHISTSNSLIDVWKLEADGHSPQDLNDFTTGLAYDAYLLEDDPDNENTYLIPLVDGDRMEQAETIHERGYQGEYDISIGTNYDDKLYLGFTLGIQTIHFRADNVYEEGVPFGEETTSLLSAFGFFQTFHTNGNGVNLKAGAIYRPVPQLRLGLAIHTPTWFNMNAYVFNNVSAYYFESPAGENGGLIYGNDAHINFAYKLKTPWRLVASAATMLGQRALVSVDYEYVDYTNAKFSNDGEGNDYDGYMADETTYLLGTNDMIKEAYRGAHNFRAGAEYRFTSTFSLRAGYAYWASPYAKGDLNSDNALQTVSGGFGLNFGHFYADASYLHKFADENKYFYNYQNPSMPEPMTSPEVRSQYRNNEFKLTLGIRF